MKTCGRRSGKAGTAKTGRTVYMRAEEGQDMEIGEVQEKKKVKYRLAGSIGVKLPSGC